MTIRHLAAAAALGFLMWSGLMFSWPTGELRDFGSFVASGRAAGEGANPYGIHPLTFHVALPGFEVWNPNLNPPISVPVFQLFARVDPATGFTVWWIISLGCYLVTVALLSRAYAGRQAWLHAGWALALAGFWDTLALGQIYLPLVLATAGAWLLLDRGRPAAAGVLIGMVVAVKPNFAVWPALLLLSGHAAAPLAAAATIVLLSALPAVLYGPEIYRQWFGLLMSDTGRGAFLTNASLPGLAQRMDLGAAGTMTSMALLILLATWALRRKPGRLEASAFGICGGIIASPIAWVHYTLFLLPVFFSRRWNPLLALAAVLLAVPVPWALSTLGADGWQQLTLGSVYSWAVLLGAAGLGLDLLGRSHGPSGDARWTSRRAGGSTPLQSWTSSSPPSTTPS